MSSFEYLSDARRRFFARTFLWFLAAFVAIQPAAANSQVRGSKNAARALRAIVDRRDNCTGAEPNEVGMQDCHWHALHAASAILTRSRVNPAFHKLLRDLFEPLVFADSEDPGTAMQIGVAGAEAELSISRAAILTGTSTYEPHPHRRRSGVSIPFAWPVPKSERAALTRRWAAIRAADCKAYPLQNCARRLDDAMRALLAP